jgi:biopolymer transport protein ExbD
MAEPQRRFLDVWIVESNTVYREVPYTVVTDWVQQGRLLDDDRLRPSGTQNWQRLGDNPSFAAFLPKIEPQRVEDQAEVLEPVEVDFAWRPRSDDDDDDVDMIPLIDISLVLLIFFMMTAAVGGVSELIKAPPASHKLIHPIEDMVWIGIRPGEGGVQEYFVGEGEKPPSDAMSRDQAVAALVQKIEERQGRAAKLNIRADLATPYELVRDLTTDLQYLVNAGKLTGIFAEVSEKVQ